MTSPSETADHVDAHVIAEHAPIGVQMWPTIAPEYADRFTLATVATVRTTRGCHVRWTYENGATRTVGLGEQVAVRITADQSDALAAAVVAAVAAGDLDAAECAEQLRRALVD